MCCKSRPIYSMQDPQDSGKNQWYECCHGPEDHRTIEPQAKLPEPGRRITKMDWGGSVKTGCKARFVVKQRGAVSLIQIEPEPHKDHPDLNQSQVSPHHPVACTEMQFCALSTSTLCVYLQPIDMLSIWLTLVQELAFYIMVGTIEYWHDSFQPTIGP